MVAQKWEYCALKGICSSEGTRAFQMSWTAIWYFTSEGVKTVEIKRDEATKAAQEIARLGQDGWEMVGFGLPDALYFKRPIQS